MNEKYSVPLSKKNFRASVRCIANFPDMAIRFPFTPISTKLLDNKTFNSTQKRKKVYFSSKEQKLCGREIRLLPEDGK